MIIKQFLFVVLVFFLFKETTAQQVKVGDKLPAMNFKQVLGPDKEIDLKPNKYKLTILDFWAHGCGSCIASFPKVEKLQAMFGDSIQIILVNYESKDSTESLFEKRDWIKKPNVKMIVGDTLLHKRFAVVGVPHIIWLDEQLQIKYIARGTSLNAGNIRKFLKGEKLNSKEAKQMVVKTSLFEREYESDMQSFSYLARYNSDFRFRGGEWGSARSFTAKGMTAIDLIRSAYAADGTVDWRRPWKTVLKIKNLDLCLKPDNLENPEDWLYNHSYVYQLVIPSGRESEKYEIMKRDLANHFPLKFYIDTIAMETLVLRKVGKEDKLKSKGGKPVNTFRKRNESAKGSIFEDKRRILKNQPFHYLLNGIRPLIEYDLEKPFVNDVAYTANVDVDFDGLTFDFFTLEALNEELMRYGLQLINEIRPVEVLVIKDVD
ncbi:MULTISPECIES: TlpA family protein disulfide reductase [unclassified Sphingobacterium]|uniref:TlpA family protein disulfide reductase n=1 Tax=unclassified Sphingobacterium TaxID=2609468 RepID=UPI0025D8BFE9|nr:MULTISPECIES: TlpA disulfide reductase family protein [unclassified Sphingobacterium]